MNFTSPEIVDLAIRRLELELLAADRSSVDLAASTFNPSELRTPAGQWTASSAAQQGATQAGAKTAPGGSAPTKPAAIKKLQKALGLPTTGQYDNATKAGVAAFQKRFGLKVDGIAGNQTMAAIAGGQFAGKLQKQQGQQFTKFAAGVKKQAAAGQPLGLSWPTDLTARTPEASTVPEPFSTSTTSNWVARRGGLPPYIQHVAHELLKHGHTESEAISMAVGIVRNWAHGHDGHGHNVSAQVAAAAAKAIARWDAMKASASSHSHTAPRGGPMVDLANPIMGMDGPALRKAAAKAGKLPPALRQRFMAACQARAKQLGIDLSVTAKQRSTAKSAGKTFPGTDKFPVDTEDKFKKACALAGNSSLPANKVRKWLIGVAQRNGWTSDIPDSWNSDGTLKGGM